MEAELAIRGGTVVDGTGAPGVRADVGIAGGRVVAIDETVQAQRVIDADGCVVAPGFIDIHTHYDAQVFWDPALTPSCFHGVTTVIAGNCGFSIAPTRPSGRDIIARTLENVEDMDVAALAEGIPWDFETFPEYLASVRQRGTCLNFGAYLGHTALRLYVMGDAAYERAATEDEVASMVGVLRDGMAAGAVGFATSFAATHLGVDGLPIPSRFAAREEFDALAAVLGELRCGVLAVAPGDPVGIAELYDVQAAVGVPVTYGALLTSPTGAHLRQVELNHQGWADGRQVWPQVSPRPLTFSMAMSDPFTLNPNVEFSALMAQSDDERLRAYADPVWRRRTLASFETQERMVPRWDTFVVGESDSHPELVGRRVQDVAAERGVHPLEVLCDLAVADGLRTRVSAVLANDDTAGVADLLQEEHCTLGLSDAGAHVGQLCDAPQATDFLGNWVRDRQVMSIESAVRKLSGVQADLFNLTDRGYLRVGAHADVAVFDPDTVAPGPVRRVRDFPAGSERLTADQPVGMRHVLVNGEVVVTDGAAEGAALDTRPGAVVRPTPR
ncbi:MAG: amidohydrolase family protein [Acidimicrobiales bacterium]|nr:amidohydrolase family protein [Acidimicrobiales bacterium]